MKRALAALLLAPLAALGQPKTGKPRNREFVAPPPTQQQQQAVRPDQFSPPVRPGSSGRQFHLQDPITPQGRVRITVRVIAAEPGAGEKDARLGPVENNLEMLPFRYGSYKLLDERTFDLDWKSDAQMELPGSRSLILTPRQLGADGRIRVHLEVLGAHPEHSRKLHTDYSIGRGGTLLVGGYRLDAARPEAGTILIAITQVVQ